MPSTKEDTQIDKVIDESFPASDPPSWTLGEAAQVKPPVGSLQYPLPSDPLTARGKTWDLSAVGEKLDRAAPLWAAGAGALGSLAFFLAGKRRPASWLMQASTFLVLFATHRELTRRRV